MRLIPVLALASALCLLPACGDKKSGSNDAGSNNSGSTETSGGTENAGKSGDSASAAVPASSANTGLSAAQREQIQAAVAKARAFLLTQQDEKGAFGDKAMEIPGNVAFTAMAVTGLVAATDSKLVKDEEAIRKGLAFMVGFQQPNGSIVDNPKWTNYCTAAAVSALASARLGEFRKNQSKAIAYLQASQISEDPKNMSDHRQSVPMKDG